MDKIAFISGETIIYWNSIVYTLATAVAICFFLAFYLGHTGNAVAGFAAIPLSIFLSVVFSRFVHWYSRADSYLDFTTAMTDYTSGGYALIGAFAGCALAAVLLRLIFLHRSIGSMLDAMSLAGCAGIAVGRLASLFNASDRGNIVEGIQSLPFVYPVTNAVSGATEYRLATFMLQAMVALVLFVVLTVFYLKGKDKVKEGDICLIFLLLYCASQVVLDSTRYDSLFFRSNGFVSIVQVLGALAIGLAIVLFSIRLVKARGWHPSYLGLWIDQLVLVGGAGYMEYHVQRHGDQAGFAYTAMSICLIGLVAKTIVIWYLAAKAERDTEVPLGAVDPQQ